MKEFDSFSLCVIILLVNIWNMYNIRELDENCVLMYLGSVLLWAFLHIFGKDSLGKLWIGLRPHIKAFIILSLVPGIYFSVLLRMLMVGLINYRALDMLINPSSTNKTPTITTVPVNTLGTTKFVITENEEVVYSNERVDSSDINNGSLQYSLNQMMPASHHIPNHLTRRETPASFQLIKTAIPSDLPSPISTPSAPISLKEEPTFLNTSSFQPVPIYEPKTVFSPVIAGRHYLVGRSDDNSVSRVSVQSMMMVVEANEKEQVDQVEQLEPVPSTPYQLQNGKKRRREVEEEEQAREEGERIDDEEENAQGGMQPTKRLAVERVVGSVSQQIPKPLYYHKSFPMLPFAQLQKSFVARYTTSKRHRPSLKRKQIFEELTSEEATILATDFIESMQRKKVRIEVIRIVKPSSIAMEKKTETPAISTTIATVTTNGSVTTTSTTATAFAFGVTTPAAVSATITTDSKPAVGTSAATTATTATITTTTSSTPSATNDPFAFTFGPSQSKAVETGGIPKPSSGKPPPSPSAASAASSIPFGIAFSAKGFGDSATVGGIGIASQQSTQQPAFTFGPPTTTSSGNSGGIAFGASTAAPVAASTTPAAAAFTFNANNNISAAPGSFTFGSNSSNTASAGIATNPFDAPANAFAAPQNISFGIGSSSSSNTTSGSSRGGRRKPHKK